MKGCQKKVICLKNTGSYLFDEAYFIISREGEKRPESEESMIATANRIIEDSMDSGQNSKDRLIPLFRLIIPFLFGVVVSCAVFGLINIL